LFATAALRHARFMINQKFSLIVVADMVKISMATLYLPN
jgi:hypothetical protein